MFLSRIEMDAACPAARRAISSPQVMHASVENCFPDKPEGKDRKLWRLDHTGGRMVLLMLSPEPPDFTGFSAQFCQKGTHGDTKDYDLLLKRIAPGQRWHFRLKANPTHSAPAEKGTRGKVYAHITTAYQQAWLLKKAAASGFTLEENGYDVVASDFVSFSQGRKDTGVSADKSAPGSSKKKIPSIQLGMVTFEGTLTVTDTTLFIQALTNGVGRAKAYGCGLLTIAGPL
jgi:CRISPR system Cascade subunit CasE